MEWAGAHLTAFATLADINRQLVEGVSRRRFIIPEVLPAGPCILFGASGSGKSGVAIITAVLVAAGLAWAGLHVEQGAVLYVAGEDYFGVQERMIAAALFCEVDPDELPIAITAPPDAGVASKGSAAHLLEAAAKLERQKGRRVSLVVIDTLAASFGGESQDDARYASIFMNEIEAISRNLQCTVLAIHHTGKTGSDMRGSQVFFDRADAVLKATRRDLSVSLKLEKIRNGPAGARFACKIDQTNIATAIGEFPVQVIRDLRASDVTDQNASVKGRRMTDAELALEVLNRMDAGSTKLKDWQAECYAVWNKPSGAANRTAFSTVKKRLEELDLIQMDGENVSVRTKALA